MSNTVPKTASQDDIVNEHALRPVRPVTHDLLELPGIRHGFFTREGGVSSGLYAGLNTGIGSGDEKALVVENRSRIAAAMGTDETRLATVHQVHSADCVVVNGPVALDERPKADALVTATPGLAIGVLTADCAPVLFADPENGVAGAAHAGWRGALTGVIAATVDAMVALGARRNAIRAVVGPAISFANYEVDDAFRARFVEADPGLARLFGNGARPGHHQFDLPAFCLMQLERTGIAAAASTGDCTYAGEDRFFSFRRTTHRGEPDYGRQMSAIMLSD